MMNSMSVDRRWMEVMIGLMLVDIRVEGPLLTRVVMTSEVVEIILG